MKAEAKKNGEKAKEDAKKESKAIKKATQSKPPAPSAGADALDSITSDRPDLATKNPTVEAAEQKYQKLQDYINKLMDSSSQLIGKATKLNKTAMSLIEYGNIQDSAAKEASAAVANGKGKAPGAGSAAEIAKAAGDKAEAKGKKKEA